MTFIEGFLKALVFIAKPVFSGILTGVIFLFVAHRLEIKGGRCIRCGKKKD